VEIAESGPALLPEINQPRHEENNGAQFPLQLLFRNSALVLADSGSTSNRHGPVDALGGQYIDIAKAVQRR
jgi:hypothetical protein